MSGSTVKVIKQQQLEKMTKHQIVLHIESLYRRQDSLDDHETRLRNSYPSALLPARESAVLRRDDKTLMGADNDSLVQHTLHLQSRIEEYFMVFQAIYRAKDARRVTNHKFEEYKAKLQARAEAVRLRNEKRLQKYRALSPEARAACLARNRELGKLKRLKAAM